jgi:hypothetical protein
VNAEQEQAPHKGFWESRTSWGWLKEKLLLEPLPGGSRWAAAFGSLLLFAFVVQVVTGILLAMNYAPSDKTAWPSVNYIQNEVPLGSLIRGVHHWGSSAMVVLLLVHLVQVFVWGAYKRPREFTWMLGVLLLFCTLGLAFTGYLLPWDQKAYWATRVGLDMVGTTPLIGDGLHALMQGGPEMGNLTLTRFFTLHGFILPGLVVLLAVAHLYFFRLHGVTPPWWESPARLKAKEQPSGRTRPGRTACWRWRSSRAWPLGRTTTRPPWASRPTPPSRTSRAPNGTSCSCSSCCNTSAGLTRSWARLCCRRRSSSSCSSGRSWTATRSATPSAGPWP